MAELIPLQPFYLNLMAQAFEAEHLSTIILDRGNGASTLYLVRESTTVPDFILEVVFADYNVAFKVTSRDQRTHQIVVGYAEGIDEYIRQLQRFLRANRLAAPKAA